MDSAFRDLTTSQGNQKRLIEDKEGSDKSPEWGRCAVGIQTGGIREGL